MVEENTFDFEGTMNELEELASRTTIKPDSPIPVDDIEWSFYNNGFYSELKALYDRLRANGILKGYIKKEE